MYLPVLALLFIYPFLLDLLSRPFSSATVLLTTLFLAFLSLPCPPDNPLATFLLDTLTRYFSTIILGTRREAINILVLPKKISSFELVTIDT